MAFEIVPAQPLTPNTAYTLEATWERGGDVLRFTTGQGPLAAAPIAVDGALEHYAAERSGSSCDPLPSGTCVTQVPSDAIVEHTFIDEFDEAHWPQLAVGSFWANLSGVDQGTNFTCIELRVRAANGTMGPPRRLCGDDYPVHYVDSPHGLACSGEGLTRNGEPIEAFAVSGCSAGDARGGAPPRLGFAALLLLLAYRLKFWTAQMRPLPVVKKPHATLVARVLDMLMKWPCVWKH